MHQTELPLVPPARLAVLLTAKRHERGLDLADVAGRSNKRFSPTMLEKIEKGLVQLDEATLRDIVQVYELEPGASLPNRSKLILDLDARQLAVGDTMLSFERSTTDVVLERYVSLLYLLRSEQPGRVLSLRDDDLDVLGSTLDLPIGRLTTDLRTIMGGLASQPTSRFSRHLSLAATGLLVAVTAAGSLIMIGATDSNEVVAEPAADDGPAPSAVVASHDGLHRGERSIAASPSPGEAVLAQAQVEAPRPAIVVASPAADRPLPVIATPTANDAMPVDSTTTHDTTLSTDGHDDDSHTGHNHDDDSHTGHNHDDDSHTGHNHDHDSHTGHNHDDDSHTGHNHAVAVAVANDAGDNAGTPIVSADEVGGEVQATSSVSTAAIDLAAIESHLGRDLQSLVPGWTIEIRGDTAGYKGLTNRSERTIAVYVDQGATVGSVAEVLVHEMGHAIDLDHLDTDARMQWVEMRGMPMVWWAGNGLNDFAVGAGDFAEGVAAYLSGSASQSAYGDFSAEQLAFVAQFVG